MYNGSWDIPSSLLQMLCSDQRPDETNVLNPLFQTFAIICETL